MKVLVLQVSDVHMKGVQNVVLDRVEAIKSAIQGADPSFSACLIAMTGDVAFSGQEDEYGVAHEFFNRLKEGIRSIRPGLQVEEVFIPGNHDCVLPENKIESRRLIVGHLLANVPGAELQDSSLVSECLEAQDNYFGFLAARPSAESHSAPTDKRLHYALTFTFGTRRVRVECYNTAWMSQRNEQPGQLLAPAWLRQDSEPDADLVLALFHHPYGWLEPINAKAFRKLIEKRADLVMTGHEHVPEQYSKQTIRGERSDYLEGAVLQDSDPADSGFNVVIFDLDRRECRVALYAWEEDHYAAKEQTDWKPFERSHHAHNAFEPSEDFANRLHNVGAVFYHPRKDALTLQDIYVYPNLQDDTPVKDKMDEASSKTIRESDLFGFLNTHRRILILGGDRSGRTSLAKTLCNDYLQQGKVPILLDGENIKGHEEKAFLKIEDSVVGQQYGAEMVERFLQLDPEEKVLIIDDLHRCRLNRRGLHSVLEHACNAYGTIILLASDLFQIEEITHAVEDQATLLSFRRCSIRPFGHRLRRKVIEKWYRLGQEYTADEVEIAESIRSAENVVNTLIGKNLLPPYPLFVLTLLQTYEAKTTHNTALGAYGYHYEALNTTALSRAIYEAKSRIMLGTIYTFVSGVAFRMFQQKSGALGEVEMEEEIQRYKQEYGMRFGNSEMLSILDAGWLLKRGPDGQYAFPYRYIYYYFVARFINENVATSTHGEALRLRVAEMTSRLHVEEYANVIIFLVYLTKDEPTIAGILSHARTLYAEYEPCDLDKHLSFVSHLTGKPLPLRLETGSLDENNEKYRHQLDEVDALSVINEEDEARLKVDQGVGDLLKINAALKTLEVMGQILRNFPGSLPGGLKLEIATESYLLGLRTLRAIYALMDEHMEPTRVFFSEVIRRVRHIEDAEELAKTTDELLYTLIFGCSYGLIKRVSQAVGSEQLEETYSKIQDPRSPVSIALIDLSIKLDHFRQFPVSEVDKIKAMAAKNTFATSLLRCFVRDHFYLYPVNFKTRQAICQKLDIVINDPKMLPSEDKKASKKK